MTDARDRFERHVDRSAGPAACWPWLGPVDRHGYGNLARAELDGRYLGTIGAHVLAVLLDGRPRPAGAHVHHRCGRPGCVNPAHLEVLDAEEHRRRHAQRHAQGVHTPRGGRTSLTYGGSGSPGGRCAQVSPPPTTTIHP